MNAQQLPQRDRRHIHEVQPSGAMLAAGVGLVPSGLAGLIAAAMGYGVPLGFVGFIALVGGAFALLTGVYRLASNIDHIARWQRR